MFALTKVLTASPLLPAVPLVATVNGAEPLTDSVLVAWPVTWPAEGELKVIVHCPAAFVFAPAFVHVPVGAVCAAPLLSVRATSTCSPAAGSKVPVPGSFSRVTVNVCGWPTALVAFGAIEIRALTQVLTAGPELSPLASVSRVSDTPPTDTVVWADTVVTPVTADERSIVHEPVPPDVVQGFAPANAPGPLSLVKLICVPSGALTAPVPSLT